MEDLLEFIGSALVLVFSVALTLFVYALPIALAILMVLWVIR